MNTASGSPKNKRVRNLGKGEWKLITHSTHIAKRSPWLCQQGAPPHSWHRQVFKHHVNKSGAQDSVSIGRRQLSQSQTRPLSLAVSAAVLRVPDFRLPHQDL